MRFLIKKGEKVFVNNNNYDSIKSLRKEEDAIWTYPDMQPDGTMQYKTENTKENIEENIEIRRVYLDFEKNKEVELSNFGSDVYSKYKKIILQTTNEKVIDIVLWEAPSHILTETILEFLKDITAIHELTVPQIEKQHLLDEHVVNHDCLVLLCGESVMDKTTELFINIVEPMCFRGGHIRIVEKTNTIEDESLKIVGVWYAKCYASGDVGI